MIPMIEDTSSSDGNCLETIRQEEHRHRRSNGVLAGRGGSWPREVQLIDTELLDCRELMPHLAAELFRRILLLYIYIIYNI